MRVEASLGQAARLLWLVAACAWEHLCHGKAHPLLAGLTCCIPASEKEEKKGKKIRSELLQSVRAQEMRHLIACQHRGLNGPFPLIDGLCSNHNGLFR